MSTKGCLTLLRSDRSKVQAQSAIYNTAQASCSNKSPRASNKLIVARLKEIQTIYRFKPAQLGNFPNFILILCNLATMSMCSLSTVKKCWQKCS